MTVADVEALQQRAANGDAAAQMALARVLDQEGRHDVALQWLQRAADGGHLPALSSMGARLLTGDGAPHMPGQGAQMVSIAADAGDADACALVAVLAASGQQRAQSWSQAMEYLFRAARLGHARARNQVGILVDNPELAARILAPGVGQPWAEARAAVDLAAWLKPPAPQTMSEDPRILAFHQFLPPSLCDWLVAWAAPVLSAARTQNQMPIDAAGAPNTGVSFALLESDVLLQIVGARIAAASGMPVGHQDAAVIQHFAPGEAFKPHYDFLDAGLPEHAETVRRTGQRSMTFLACLNDGYGGGETDFPLLNQRFQGGLGDAVLFRNVDANGAVDKRMLYAGIAPTGGEKWMLSRWIRDRPAPQY